MPAVRQPSFAGGELAPSLWGRTDLPRYGFGLRRCYNFFVSKYGNAMSRAGAQFLGLGSSSVVTITQGESTLGQMYAGDNVKLVPFLYSDTPTDSTTGSSTSQNYVLEFGEKSLRIWKNGALLAFALTGNIPYLAADLYKLRWAQSGDVLTLTCAGYAPATLTRGVPSPSIVFPANPVFPSTDDSQWTFAQVSFTRPLPQTFNPAGPAGGRIQLAGVSWDVTGGVPAADPTHTPSYWSWVITEFIADTRGNISESEPVHVGGTLFQGHYWNNLVAYPAGYCVAWITTVGATQVTRFWEASANLAPDITTGGTSPPVNSGFASANWAYIAQYDPAVNYTVGFIVSDGSDTAGPPTTATTLYRSLQHPNIGHNPATSPTFWENMNANEWVDPIGANDVLCLLSQDRPQVINIQGAAFPPVATSGTFKGYRIYRGRGGIYGYVGDSQGPTFTDYGAAPPDLSVSPPQGFNPFQLPGAGVEAPTAVTYFQDRLTFGGTPTRPISIFASANGDYLNFDQRFVVQESDSTIFGLLARKRELIRAMVGLDRLFVLTDGGVWVVGGAQGSPFSPDSVDAHVYSDIGADWPSPLIVGGEVLYVRDKGTGVRSVQFDWQRGGYASQSLSDAAEHLFLGESVADWCFSENPWGVVWAARSDGLLLSGTHCTEDNLWAWSQHQIVQQPQAGGFGKVLSVCSIPELNGDTGTVEDAVYLALQGGALLPPPAWSSVFTYTLGALVTYNGQTYRSQQNGNLNHTPNTSPAYWLPFLSTFGVVRIVRFGSRNPYIPSYSPPCLDSYTEVSAPAVVGGFIKVGLDNSFNGESLFAIVDGVLSGPYVATTDGFHITSVSIPAVGNPRLCRVGYKYNCEVEPLDPVPGRSQRKELREVDFEVIGAGTVLVGQDSAHLVASEPINANNQLLRVQVPGSIGTAPRGFLRQPNPAPVSLVAVIRKYEMDEDP